MEAVDVEGGVRATITDGVGQSTFSGLVPGTYGVVHRAHASGGSERWKSEKIAKGVKAHLGGFTTDPCQQETQSG